MAARTTTTRSKKVDTRKPNMQPNHLQATLTMVLGFLGKSGVISVPQNEKLSEKGNVTFNGGIRKGWKLPGIPAAVLATITAEVEGVTFNVGGQGVHTSEAGNPTVCLTGILNLPVTGDKDNTVAYMGQLWVTHSVKKNRYSANLTAFPAALNTGGPAVVGEVSEDFDIDE